MQGLKNNFDFRSVPIPPKMMGLDTDKRGYPIPFNVLRNEDGLPFFTVNDDAKYIKCLRERLCAICGSLLRSDMWFVGGLKSAFHPQGAFIDSPVHYECGNYSLKVCPYLATIRYANYLGADKVEKLQKKVGDNHLLIDPTVDAQKPEYFAFVKTRNFQLVESNSATAGFYLKPERPYLNIELWNAGRVALPIMYKSIIEKNECQFISSELPK